MNTVLLPNGVEVFNATPHPITFFEEGWNAPVTVASHEVVNAYSHNERVREEGGVSFVRVEFRSKYDGERLIQKIKDSFPKALIVGSMVAAQAYPEEVVAPKPYFVAGGRRDKSGRVYNPSEFTIFLKKEDE